MQAALWPHNINYDLERKFKYFGPQDTEVLWPKQQGLNQSWPQGEHPNYTLDIISIHSLVKYVLSSASIIS